MPLSPLLRSGKHEVDVLPALVQQPAPDAQLGVVSVQHHHLRILNILLIVHLHVAQRELDLSRESVWLGGLDRVVQNQGFWCELHDFASVPVGQPLLYAAFFQDLSFNHVGLDLLICVFQLDGLR